MNDYLDTYKKFEDVKEVKDYIDEVTKLRQYYSTQQFDKMIEHIRNIMVNHPMESLSWNNTHPVQPISYQDYYQNAEVFMQVQGAKIITSKVVDYSQRLLPNEVAFILHAITRLE